MPLRTIDASMFPTDKAAARNALQIVSDLSLQLQLADLMGDRQGFYGSIADPFDDETDVYRPSGGIDGYTESMLQFEGADESTTITDTNGVGSVRTWTIRGSSKLDNAVVPPYGTTALLCNGTSGGVDTPAHSSLNLGSGDFTIELWFNYLGAAAATSYVAGQGDGGSTIQWYFSHNAGNKMTFGVTGNGSTQTSIASTTNITTSGWHHLAASRSGNTLRLFLDGVQEGGDVAFSGSTYASSDVVGVGKFLSATFNGLIKGFRLTKGLARWTANFTPPNAAYFVDTSGSVNALYNGAADLYSPIFTPGADQIPTMTAETTGAVTITASGYYNNGAGYVGNPWKVGAKDGGATAWSHASANNSGTATGSPGWLRFDLGSAKTIASYTLTPRTSSANRSPATWTLEGSNTGSFSGEQVVLDTRTSVTDWVSEVSKSFNVTSPGSYRYYRLNISAQAGGPVLELGEANLYLPGVYSDMTLVSGAFPAISVPTNVRLAIQAIPNEAITLNTDLKGWVSRDGGTTWTQVTLALAVDGTAKIYDGIVSVAGQPSGTSMKWKITTHNGKNIDVSGVVLQWS